ncbi:FecR domain-containing protein [Methylophaga lonarensis]|nr:FecR family protein [Methylophaga lonarensis]
MDKIKHSQSASGGNAIQQACAWMARLWADDATDKDHAACLAWRQTAPEHEQAWQQVSQLQQRFNQLPEPQIGSKLLRQRTQISRRQFLSLGGLGLGVGLLSAGHLGSNYLYSTDYATKTGEIQNTTLADGTRLFLNTGSRVDIDFNQHKREILLHAGEIYIETAPHPLPLTVISRQGSLVPLGTRFSVRLLEQHARLAVYEGRVQIQPAQSTESRVIESGLGANFSRNGFLADYAVNASGMAWTAHKLAVANMPLTEFIDELSRYRSGRLRASPELASLTVTGVFSLKDTDRVLAQLTDILPVKLQSYSSFWVNVLPG